MGKLLTHSNSIYRFVINRNRQFGMGKQDHGEMQSIHALKIVLKEIERRGIRPASVREVMTRAEAEAVPPVALPAYLGSHLLGAEDTDRLVRHLPGYDVIWKTANS
jgi:hypothetical protein